MTTTIAIILLIIINNNNNENSIRLQLTYIKIKPILFLVALTKGHTTCSSHTTKILRYTKDSEMADAANNNRSVIVYEPATQTVSIKKIGDLGKFGHFILLSLFLSLILS